MDGLLAKTICLICIAWQSTYSAAAYLNFQIQVSGVPPTDSVFENYYADIYFIVSVCEITRFRGAVCQYIYQSPTKDNVESQVTYDAVSTQYLANSRFLNFDFWDDDILDGDDYLGSFQAYFTDLVNGTTDGTKVTLNYPLTVYGGTTTITSWVSSEPLTGLIIYG